MDRFFLVIILRCRAKCLCSKLQSVLRGNKLLSFRSLGSLVLYIGLAFPSLADINLLKTILHEGIFTAQSSRSFIALHHFVDVAAIIEILEGGFTFSKHS